MRSPIASSIFLRLSADYANDAELDFRRLNNLIVKKLQNRFLVGFGLRIERREVVASLFVSERPDRQVGFDFAFDQTFDSHIPVAETRRLNLRTQHPTTEDQPQ